jgi:hypothetical protein
VRLRSDAHSWRASELFRPPLFDAGTVALIALVNDKRVFGSGLVSSAIAPSARWRNLRTVSR